MLLCYPKGEKVMSWWNNKTKLLELNDRDEHDGKARRIKDCYIREFYRARVSKDGLALGIEEGFTYRDRYSTKEHKVLLEDMETLREMLKWHDELKAGYIIK